MADALVSAFQKWRNFVYAFACIGSDNQVSCSFIWTLRACQIDGVLRLIICHIINLFNADWTIYQTLKARLNKPYTCLKTTSHNWCLIVHPMCCEVV